MLWLLTITVLTCTVFTNLTDNDYKKGFVTWLFIIFAVIYIVASFVYEFYELVTLYKGRRYLYIKRDENVWQLCRNVLMILAIMFTIISGIPSEITKTLASVRQTK